MPEAAARVPAILKTARSVRRFSRFNSKKGWSNEGGIQNEAMGGPGGGGDVRAGVIGIGGPGPGRGGADGDPHGPRGGHQTLFRRRNGGGLFRGGRRGGQQRPGPGLWTAGGRHHHAHQPGGGGQHRGGAECPPGGGRKTHEHPGGAGRQDRTAHRSGGPVRQRRPVQAGGVDPRLHGGDRHPHLLRARYRAVRRFGPRHQRRGHRPAHAPPVRLHHVFGGHRCEEGGKREPPASSTARFR